MSHEDQPDFIDESWKMLPHTLAETCSNGKWKPYNYLVYLGNKITEGIARGNARFIVCMHPRVGKSEFISHWTPIWLLENFPSNKIILCSYEASIAEYWGRRVRDEIENNELLTNTIIPHARAAHDFHTVFGGGMKTAGVGGPVTSRGADTFIIDDIFKNWSEAMSARRREWIRDWFDSVAYTRLEPSASMILLMTRWHEGDLAGYLLNEHPDNWEAIVLPALAEDNDPLGRKPGDALCPERFPVEVLEQIKRASNRVWLGLYQQRPVSSEGEIWKRDSWRYYSEAPVFEEMIQSWDMNFKEGKENDFVCGQVWGRVGIHYYLVALTRGQWGFTRALKEFTKISFLYPDAKFKLVENKANGPAIENVLTDKISGIILVEPKGGKMARAIAAEPAIESGHVHLPNPSIHPWVKEFIDESASFPKGKHDDQVDSASQAINFFEERTQGPSFDIY
jgi:predicted phage terminase large subunit-like protein